MLYRSALPEDWTVGLPPPHPIRNEQHATAILLNLRHGWTLPPRMAVPVRGFTSTWKRRQPYPSRRQPPPPVSTHIMQQRTVPPGHALHKHRKRARLIRDTDTGDDASQPTHDLTFLTERRSEYKAVQLRFARRQLVDARVLGCPPPILLYSAVHGAVSALTFGDMPAAMPPA
jgi:hypothetical protein